MSFFEDAHLDVIIDRFQWDVETDESLFLPDIPDDFVLIGMPSGAAVSAIASSVVLAGMSPFALYMVEK